MRRRESLACRSWSGKEKCDYLALPSSLLQPLHRVPQYTSIYISAALIDCRKKRRRRVKGVMHMCENNKSRAAISREEKLPRMHSFGFSLAAAARSESGIWAQETTPILSAARKYLFLAPLETQRTVETLLSEGS
jgi:hypothetical protein